MCPLTNMEALALGDIARVGTGCQCRCRLISYCSKRRQGAPVVWPSGVPSCGCELRLPPLSADRPTPPAVCHASHPCRADCAPTSCSAASPVRSRPPDIPSPVVCGSSSHRQAPTHRVRRRGSLRLCRQRRRQAKPTSSFTAVGAPCIGRSIASVSPRCKTARDVTEPSRAALPSRSLVVNGVGAGLLRRHGLPPTFRKSAGGGLGPLSWRAPGKTAVGRTYVTNILRATHAVVKHLVPPTRTARHKPCWTCPRNLTGRTA